MPLSAGVRRLRTRILPVDAPAAFDRLVCPPTMTATALADYDDQPDEVS